MKDERVWEALECAYCDNPAVWAVSEYSVSRERIYVCDDHEYTAFS